MTVPNSNPTSDLGLHNAHGLRILVTGAGGFIGRHTVDMLSGSADSVAALTGPGDPVREWPANVDAHEIDVCDTGALHAHFEGADAVVHLAGPPMVRDSFHQAKRFLDIHAGGTTNVLQAAMQANIQRFVYLSSAEVYGQPLRNPVDEQHRLLARSPYGAAKIGAEKMVEAFTQFAEVSAMILRPFSVYGPGQTTNGLLGTIIQQLRTKARVELADLRPIRDYLFVTDLARAILASCTIDSLGCQTLNLGSGVGTSVARFAELTAAAMGVDKQITQARAADRPGAANIFELVSDCRQAKSVLGWSPQVDLLTGLQATIRSGSQP